MNLAQLFSQQGSGNGTDNALTNLLGITRQGEGPLLPGQGQLQFNPQQVQSNAPVYDWNNNPAAARATAQMGGAMGAGWSNSGVKALLPGDLNYFEHSWTPGETEAGQTALPEKDDYLSGIRKGLSGVAEQLGYDLSGYDLNSTRGFAGDRPLWQQQWEQNGAPDADKKSLYDLYNDLNKDLSNFQRIRGASAGWDGKGNMRSTAETLYYQTEPGKWVPISTPKSGVKREHKGWAREEGADTLAALSVIMPAFGGWAGLLGQGTAGTLSAGSGLGLTSGLGSVIGNGLANTVVNSVMNGIMSGANPQSLLAGLGMSTLGQGAMGLAGGKSLSDVFGGALPNTSGNFTGIQDFLKSGTGQAFLRSAPMRTESGQGLNQLLQAGSRLANSLGT